MSKVTVYQFTIYDIQSNQVLKSRRWGTREGIKRVCGAALEPGVEVDASAIEWELEGLTARGYDPRRHATGAGRNYPVPVICPHCGNQDALLMPSRGDRNDYRCLPCGDFSVDGTTQHLFEIGHADLRNARFVEGDGRRWLKV